MRTHRPTLTGATFATVLIALTICVPALADGPTIYTYDQAKTAGLEVGPTPSEAGLAACPTTPDDGFPTIQALDTALAAGEAAYGENGGPNPPCMADTTHALFSTESRPDDTSHYGYRWQGTKTCPTISPGTCSGGNYQGARADIEVGNAAICTYPCFGQPYQHYVSSVRAKTPAGNYLEAGWWEDPNFQHYCNTTRQLAFAFTHVGTNNVWSVYCPSDYSFGRRKFLCISRSTVWRCRHV